MSAIFTRTLAATDTVSTTLSMGITYISVLCKTDKGLIVLRYDHVFELWYDPQNPVIAFKSKVFKWCEVK